MVILICLLVAAVIFIVLYLLINKFTASGQMIQDRLRNLQGDKGANKILFGEKQTSLLSRILNPVSTRMNAGFKKLTPAAIYNSVEKDILASGNFQGRGMSGFLYYIIGLTLGLLLIGVLFISRNHVSFFRGLLIIIGAIGTGVGFPVFVLKSMVAERQDAIRRAMPDVLDLLCVSVQAGMGFDGAMGKVTAKMHGPLIEECDRLLQELRMGVTRRNALLRLSERCGIEEMQLFTAALIQAEKLGVGLAQVLEVQSENMREIRRQRAREEAAKLPTKILFPTLIFIFPVIFVVALGPPLVAIVQSFMKFK